METLIDNAIKILLGEIKTGLEPDKALKFTQAALNLAHAKITLSDVKNVVNRK